MKKKNIRILIITACIFAVLIVYDRYRSKSLAKNGVYVIGRIDRITGAKGGLRAFVTYKYRGEVLHADYISSRIEYKDTLYRYFIKIDTQDLHSLDFDYNDIVPDSIKEAPYDGWRSIPVSVSTR